VTQHTEPKEQLAIGLMSGTSLDGIDAALVSFPRPQKKAQDFAQKSPKSPVLPPEVEHPKLLHFLTHPLNPKWVKRLHQLNLEPSLTLKELAQLQLALGKAFSGAAQVLMQQTGVRPEQIAVIGSHGQTVFHAPHLEGNLGISLQLGHPAVIAKRTGMTVAGDFRVDDMALGGQGAPLAPALHQMLFEEVTQQLGKVAVVNIGGISNLSLLRPQKVFGFDIGPGNGLMDEVCQRYFDCDYDENGALARAGKVDAQLLNQLKQHPFFHQMPPKSTGKETFNFHWLTGFKLPESPKDLLATLNRLTADLIAEAVKQHAAQAVYLCGGGALNATLIENIQQTLNVPVCTTQALGIDPMAIEAMLCAWLGVQRLNQQPIDLTQITGSGKPAILGGLWCP